MPVIRVRLALMMPECRTQAQAGSATLPVTVTVSAAGLCGCWESRRSTGSNGLMKARATLPTAAICSAGRQLGIA
jgi:hypothetical protein